MAEQSNHASDDNMIDRATREFGQGEKPREEGSATTNTTTGADSNTGGGRGDGEKDPKS